MKRTFYIFSALVLLAVTACAKKVKLTIDGTVYPTQSSLYLVINEDIENAQMLPIKDGQFSTTIKVDRDAFVRIHDYKEWPERSVFVLLPDSRHISIDWRNGTIEGSTMSKKLQDACREVSKQSPEGFHIDVFSDDKEAWASARETEKTIREGMQLEQIKTIEQVIKKNKDNYIPAWIVYCHHSLLEGPYRHIIDENKNQKWSKHTIIQKSGILDKHD